MSYRITYGQLGNEQDVYNPAAGVYLVSGGADFEANVSGVLEMELPPNHPLWGKIEPMSTDMEIRLYEDGEEILRGRMINDHDDLNRIGHVKIEDQQAYLNDVNCRPYTTYYVEDQADKLPIISGNLAQHLIEDYNAHCTAGREFGYLGSEIGDDLRVCTTEEKSIRDELADTIYAAGAYAVVKSVGEARTIEFMVHPPHGEQVIRVAQNMLSYEHESDYTGIVTAIIAKGKGSKSEAESDDSAHEEEFGLETIQSGDYGAIRIDGDRAISVEGEKKYGIIEERRSYECSTPAGLFELVERDLDNAVIDAESVDVSAYDLHNLNPDIKPLRLCNVYTIEAPSGTYEMMLTEISLDICDPSKSTYHFGRLASSLSRTGVAEASASRSVQRDNTYDANRDRIDNEHDHKKLIDGLDEIGDGLKDVEHLYEGFDGRLDGMDEAIEIAKESAQNTAYGICNTGSEVRAKSVQVAYPQGGTFALKDGTVISVKMTNANAADKPTLQVNGTGAKPIVTSGINEAWWTAGQTVLFTYMGGNWCTMSSPVWTSSAIIGDPRDYHIELQPDEFSMCVGANKYINADPDGFQVGYTATVDSSSMAKGRRNIHLSDSEIAFRQGQTNYLTISDTGVQVGMDAWKHINIGSSEIVMCNPTSSSVDHDLHFGWNETNGAVISSASSVSLHGGYTLNREPADEITLSAGGFGMFRTRDIYLQAAGIHIGSLPTTPLFTDCTVNFSSITRINLNQKQVIMRSLVAEGTGMDYVYLSASVLGASDLGGYAFAVSNGDWQANNVVITGTSYDSGYLVVHFDRATSSRMRLNIIGVPVGTISTTDDPGQEGPEIFDDQNNDSDQEAA